MHRLGWVSHLCDDLVMAKFSSYAENLPQDAKTRYLATIGGVDPFLAGAANLVGETCSQLPALNACDLVSYLVLKTNFITATQFKARKGLEAYNQFVCRWVKDVITKKVSGKYLTCTRVRYCLVFSITVVV